jgi:hypothetical protein
MKAQFITLSALVAFSVTAFWNQSRAQNEEVRAGQTVTSPNGMFTVQYTHASQWNRSENGTDPKCGN